MIPNIQYNYTERCIVLMHKTLHIVYYHGNHNL